MYESTASPATHQINSIGLQQFPRCVVSPFLPARPLPASQILPSQFVSSPLLINKRIKATNINGNNKLTFLLILDISFLSKVWFRNLELTSVIWPSNFAASVRTCIDKSHTALHTFPKASSINLNSCSLSGITIILQNWEIQTNHKWRWLILKLDNHES